MIWVRWVKARLTGVRWRSSLAALGHMASAGSIRLRHPLVALLLLFVCFRLFSLPLLRPGGFIADYSDYEFYYAWGQLTAMGYDPYVNTWSTYPPLFPALMLPIYELASRIPPWVDERLFFHLLFGLQMTVFETGNLILIYRLAYQLALEEASPADTVTVHHNAERSGLVSAVFYALLFAPFYTMLGFYESMPIFFFLLALDALSSRRRSGWLLSAAATGLGILSKLIPIILAPVAVRWLGMKLSWLAAREEWFRRGSPGNFVRPLLYTVALFAMIAGVGYPLVHGNLELGLSSLRVQSIRPPWQSLWALLDGYTGFGLVPLEIRNLDALSSYQWPTRIPWAGVNLGFALVFFWLYTRPLDWSKRRTLLSFSAVSLIGLLLYSKGWSPQFLSWPLPLIAILLPTLRGVVVAIALTVINIVESFVYLVLLPEQTWILTSTVLARTLLLVLLALEFWTQIAPQPGRQAALRRWNARLTWGALTFLTIFALAATPATTQAYWERHLNEHPCREAITILQDEAKWPARLIATSNSDTWHLFYPWLRNDYHFYVMDGYNTQERPPIKIMVERLTTQVSANDEVWLLLREPQQTIDAILEQMNLPASQPRMVVLESQLLGAAPNAGAASAAEQPCHLYRILKPAAAPLGVVQTPDGEIKLLGWRQAAPTAEHRVRFVLYWQAEHPIRQSYTVFTQLFALDEQNRPLSEGALLAQQDNLPVRGLAPTSTWQPGVVIRDPYELTLPAAARPGVYRLWAGMYDASGRQTIRLADGTQHDHWSFDVRAE